MFRKNKLAMLVGEFLGTAALTLVVLNVKNSQLGLAFFISLAAAITVIIMSFALAGISGAIFNPAMTVGLWTVRKIKTLQALSYIAVQLLGGAVAWILFKYLIKLDQAVPNHGQFDAHLLVAEAVGTFVFAFAWAAAVYQKFSLASKVVTIGGGLFVGSIAVSLVTYTSGTTTLAAGVLNPAVALGIREWGWGTFVLGPVLGAIVGFNLFNLLFVTTEVAEVEEAKAEKAAAKVVAKPAVAAKAEAKKPATKKAEAAKKPVAKKAEAKKPAAKKTTAARRKNPNAV